MRQVIQHYYRTERRAKRVKRLKQILLLVVASLHADILILVSIIVLVVVHAASSFNRTVQSVPISHSGNIRLVVEQVENILWDGAPGTSMPNLAGSVKTQRLQSS